MRHRSNRPNRQYAAIPNAAMRDDSLSIEARGLLALMMTYADEWVFQVRHLQKVCACGRDRLQKMLRELKQAGYVQRVPNRSADGKVSGSTWVINDEPHREPENTVVGSTESLKSRPPEKPTAGKSAPLRKPTSKENQVEERAKGSKLLFSEDWKPSEKACEKAEKLGFSASEISEQAMLCSAHYRAEGKRFADLNAVFEAWIVRAKKWRSEKQPEQAESNRSRYRRIIEEHKGIKHNNSDWWINH